MSTLDGGLLRKHELEASLHQEKKLIEDGILKEDNPLDVSENFRRLCEACRRGDLKVCQEMITEGVNINARDPYDYTALILASLCGNYEVVQLLLESGALCERDTFQGERCLYNALNDKIRNLLLSYDYSKSSDPLQPLSSHITSLLTREQPQTADIVVTSPALNESFHLHKFVLSARSPYFHNKLAQAPESQTWKLPDFIPPQSFGITIRHLYLAELPRDIGGGPGTGFSDADVLAGTDKICKHLEIQSLSQLILDSGDRRLARQRRADEVARGRDQIEVWFRENVLKHKISVDSWKAKDIKWDKNNGIFADVLLRTDEEDFEEDEGYSDIPSSQALQSQPPTNALGIPLASASNSRSVSRNRPSKTSLVYPCHRAMLIRSEFFSTMFSSAFKEAQETPHLHIIPIDCSPTVLEIVLTFLYTEKADFGLEIAIDVLFAADLLLIEKLKVKAAVVISTLGNGTATAIPGENAVEDEALDIYGILRAAWLTRVQRLEEFAARYIAYRLEAYIDDLEFAELVKESASRISKREETDSIELLDDIRYYLSERFRLRFEDTGLEEAMDEVAAQEQQQREEEERAAATTAADDKENGAGGEPLPQWGSAPAEDEAVDINTPPSKTQADERPAAEVAPEDYLAGGVIRTLDGEVAGDEFDRDAMNYQILLGKIEVLLEKLKLDA